MVLKTLHQAEVQIHLTQALPMFSCSAQNGQKDHGRVEPSSLTSRPDLEYTIHSNTI